jgi:hypothetical protein
MKLFGKVMLIAGCVVLLSGGAAASDVRLAGILDPVVVDANASFISLNLDEPEEPAASGEKAEKKGEWGGFGAPMIHYLTLDMGPLDPMTDDRGIDRFDQGMILVGGIGGLINKNFRFGGFGFGGDQDVADRDAAGERISAEMSISGGGLFFEFNNTLSPDYGVLMGTYLGAGNIELEASGPDLSLIPEREDWDGDASVFMAYPYLGFWAAPTDWMWVQLDAGYLYFDFEVSGSEAENDMGVEMIDDGMTGGFMAGLKINFGHNPNR